MNSGMRNPLANIPLDNEQAVYHLRQLCEIVDGLDIHGWPIVINPQITEGMSICLDRDHTLCITGSHEIQMTQTTYSALAVPQNMALVSNMVERVQAALKNHYVVMTLDGRKFYAVRDGQAGRKDDRTVFTTHYRKNAESFADRLNRHEAWLDAVEKGLIKWTVESEPWKR